MKNLKKNIPGEKISDGKKHSQHHAQWSRRSFLSSLGITSGVSLLLGNLPVHAAKPSPLGLGLLNADSDRVLVLLQLNGGNDGLNTLIPLYDYDYYRNQRRRIGIAENSILNLNDEHGIQQSMSDLMSLWEEDKMKVVQNVGYPNPNLSHFRGTDIWSAASDEDDLLRSGWLGRWLDNEFPDYANMPPEIPPAVQIGSYGSLIFNNGMFNLSISVTDPSELAEIAQNGQLYDTSSLPSSCYGEELSFVRTITNSTFAYAEAIKEAYDKSSSSVTYENILNNLGDQLELVARLIKGELGTKIYMVSISGFDTHANQNATHPLIWQGIAQAMKTFYDDLGDKGNDVLTMTFSEFGRRIEENASEGTDHGTAAPMFLFGPGVERSDIVGENANLQDPDQFGNLKFGTDFREVYATVLEHWLCVDSDLVDQALGAVYPRIDDLVINCGLSTAVHDKHVDRDSPHKALYNDHGDILIQYELFSGALTSLHIVDMQGRTLQRLEEGFLPAGRYSSLFRAKDYNVPPGTYAYRLVIDGRVYSALLSVAY